MNSAAHYFHWGVIEISVANLVVILLMIAVFVAAIVLPFPGPKHDPRKPADTEGDSAGEATP